MKQTAILLVALASVSGCESNRETIRRKNPSIFRDIVLTNGDCILLGQSLDEIRHLLDERDGRWFVRPGEFRGAKSIEITCSPKKQVKAIHFAYRPDREWREAKRSYEQRLGAATELGDAAIWHDGRTRFELVRSVNQASLHSATLTDCCPPTKARDPSEVTKE